MLIAGLVFVVVVMVYASLFRSSPGNEKIEEQVQREIRKQTLSDPEQEFREQIKSQEQRLQKQRDQDISEQKEYIDEKTNELLQNNEQVLQELLSGTKSAVESWNENELVRVRQSRQADFNFEIFTGVADTEQKSTEITADEFLQREQAILAGMQQKLNNNTEPRNALADYTQSTNLLTDLLSTEGKLPETGKHFNQAGYPESDLTQAPGDEFSLLSIGSIMQAKLDQKIISDYAGPYRCRIEQNVMDVTQKHVLIPAGSLCTGSGIADRLGTSQPYYQ